MSTKTLGWLVGTRDGKNLGSGEFYPNFIPTGPVPNFCPIVSRTIVNLSAVSEQLRPSSIRKSSLIVAAFGQD